MSAARLLDLDAWKRRLKTIDSLAYEIPFWAQDARWRALEPALAGELERVFALRGDAEIEEYLEAFAADYARFAGSPHGVGTSSGTAALTFALQGLGIGPGDEVLVPCFTFVASALAVCNAGASPIFSDAAPDGQLDVRDLERRRTPRTKAVMVAHLFGAMSDPAPLLEYCRREGLFLVEDSCQAHGLAWRGRPAGSFGDAAAVSFNFMKLLSGPGNGGMLLSRRAEVVRRARQLRDPETPDELVLLSRRTPAYLDPMQAACVRAGMKAHERTLAHHSLLAGVYRECLSGLPLRVLGAEPGRPNIWYRFVVRVPERERVRRHLKDRGIEARACQETPLSRLAAFRGAPGAAGEFPEAESLCREALALPIGVHMTADDAARAAESLASFFQP